MWCRNLCCGGQLMSQAASGPHPGQTGPGSMPHPPVQRGGNERHPPEEEAISLTVRFAMPMRVHEVHPALAHFPVALLPTAVAADLIGRFTDNDSLMDMGRQLMPLAAASVAATGVAGFAAQEAVKTSDVSHDLLVTHRTLNIGLLALSLGLAAIRARSRRPSAGYLLAGLAGAALVTYSGYLGGRMVYTHGVGV